MRQRRAMSRWGMPSRKDETGLFPPAFSGGMAIGLKIAPFSGNFKLLNLLNLLTENNYKMLILNRFQNGPFSSSFAMTPKRIRLQCLTGIN